MRHSYVDLLNRLNVDLTVYNCKSCSDGAGTEVARRGDVSPSCDTCGGQIPRNRLLCLYRVDGNIACSYGLVPASTAEEGILVVLRAAEDESLTGHALREELVRGMRVILCSYHSDQQVFICDRSKDMETVVETWRNDLSSSDDGAELRHLRARVESRRRRRFS